MGISFSSSGPEPAPVTAMRIGMKQVLALLPSLFLHGLGDLAKALVGQRALRQDLGNECLQHLEGGGVGEQFLEFRRGHGLRRVKLEDNPRRLGKLRQQADVLQHGIEHAFDPRQNLRSGLWAVIGRRLAGTAPQAPPSAAVGTPSCSAGSAS